MGDYLHVMISACSVYISILFCTLRINTYVLVKKYKYNKLKLFYYTLIKTEFDRFMNHTYKRIVKFYLGNITESSRSYRLKYIGKPLINVYAQSSRIKTN